MVLELFLFFFFFLLIFVLKYLLIYGYPWISAGNHLFAGVSKHGYLCGYGAGDEAGIYPWGGG